MSYTEDSQIDQWLEEAGCPEDAQHFYKRLFQRYNKLVLTWDEYLTICKEITDGKLQPLRNYHNRRLTATYKYVLQRESSSSRRIYLVAYRDGKRLISAYKPKWLSTKKKRNNSRQRRQV